jgi:PTH1 family peptidyl-tRNA hydrolase
VIDELARRWATGLEGAPANAMIARVRPGEGEPVLLVKPLTMMNASGEAVGALTRYYRIDLANLLIVADDVNLPLGRLRARALGSAGGHNGFKSIAQHLGTEEFARLRIGVGRGDGRLDLADHVLARFDVDERPVIEAAILRASDAAALFVSEGIGPVMNRFNPVESPTEDNSSDRDN